LADVEWTVQLLQMCHAHDVPDLRTTRTLEALHAAAAAELMTTEEASQLESAWRLVSRIRNAIVLMRGKPAESMVDQASERAGVAHLLGYGIDQSERMVDEYLRTTRLARRVVERVFWA
jgi:[glutamine synthetase] adenylyltransferase / [glutamine synthetase]-adenylyl-L-tyrosine phosphorylase